MALSESIQACPVGAPQWLIGSVLPLIGVVVGGLIGYLSIRAGDRRKWKQEKAERMNEHTRDAIGIALEWIAPLEKALMRGGSLAQSLQSKSIDQDEFLKKFPGSLPEISDPLARLRIFLPVDTYNKLFVIDRGIDALKAAARRKDNSRECINLQVGLQSQIGELHKSLKAAYLQTLE
jgi:hypothetical protein